MFKALVKAGFLSLTGYDGTWATLAVTLDVPVAIIQRSCGTAPTLLRLRDCMALQPSRWLRNCSGEMSLPTNRALFCGYEPAAQRVAWGERATITTWINCDVGDTAHNGIVASWTVCCCRSASFLKTESRVQTALQNGKLPCVICTLLVHVYVEDGQAVIKFQRHSKLRTQAGVQRIPDTALDCWTVCAQPTWQYLTIHESAGCMEITFGEDKHTLQLCQLPNNLRPKGFTGQLIACQTSNHTHYALQGLPECIVKDTQRIMFAHCLLDGESSENSHGIAPNLHDFLLDQTFVELVDRTLHLLRCAKPQTNIWLKLAAVSEYNTPVCTNRAQIQPTDARIQKGFDLLCNTLT